MGRPGTDAAPAGAGAFERAAAGVRHLYVHIPFCRSLCTYCDFFSEQLRLPRDAGRAARYLERLREELSERGGLLAPAVETIFVGGGTPTWVPQALLVPLLAELGERLDAGGEFTVEANPGTMDAALLEAMAGAGVTRLSLGIQSFREPLRRVLGRAVGLRQIDGALAAIRESGWREWNLDLIFGIPGQDWAAVQADLWAAVQAGPPHVSLYDLTYTGGFTARVEQRLGTRARERAAEFSEEYYEQAVALLEAAGYLRYEVSNFALPGHECRHNSSYWEGDDYLGVGASAVSTVGAERETNVSTVDGYVAGQPREVEVLSLQTKRVERAMLGLRTAAGVRRADVAGALDDEAFERAEGAGLAGRRCDTLFLSPRGLNLSNAVLAAVLRLPESL